MNSLRLLSRLVNINPSSSILIKQSKNILDPYKFKLKFCRLQSFSMATTPIYQDEKFVFRQLFDRESCTYTYLIADPASREAVLIDPVFDLADRDAQLVKDLDLNLTYVINTHCHADHITGTGLLKKMMGRGVSSAIATAAGAIADKFLEPGQIVNIGALQLEVRPTPGHTSGCVSYVFHAGRRVFTGDTLLIRGCGRTDFQEGDSETLYHSVHDKLFQLPDDYLVFPAHDYKGVLCSTIGEEKKFNPRLTKDLEEFKLIMSNLNLPYPKMMDRSVPANKVCGLFSLPPEFEQKLQEVIAQAQANAN